MRKREVDICGALFQLLEALSFYDNIHFLIATKKCSLPDFLACKNEVALTALRNIIMIEQNNALE